MDVKNTPAPAPMVEALKLREMALEMAGGVEGYASALLTFALAYTAGKNLPINEIPEHAAQVAEAICGFATLTATGAVDGVLSEGGQQRGH